jgi:hypothetical protein
MKINPRNWDTLVITAAPYKPSQATEGTQDEQERARIPGDYSLRDRSVHKST